VLVQLHDRLRRDRRIAPLLEPAWQLVTQLAGHEENSVAEQAAWLAVLGGQITPAVTKAIGDMIDVVTGEVTDSYDEQVFGEELLSDIASVGPRLSALGPKLARVLVSESPAFRAAGAEVAGAIGDHGLAAALARAERSENDGHFEIGAVRAMMRLALWRLEGDPRWLDRSLDDAEDSLVYSFRIYLALTRAQVDELLLAGLARAARRPAWHRSVCDVLAKIGPRGAATVAQLPPPSPDHVDAEYAFHHARWRTGVLDDAQLVAALQPLLPTTWHAWKPYVETGLGTAAWTTTIRAALADETQQRAVLEALQLSPLIGVRFVPSLVEGGHDDAIETLWRLAPEAFWRNA
jgi:hypothetical protein